MNFHQFEPRRCRPGSYQATCSCGWNSTSQFTSKKAALQHWQEIHANRIAKDQGPDRLERAKRQAREDHERREVRRRAEQIRDEFRKR